MDADSAGVSLIQRRKLGRWSVRSSMPDLYGAPERVTMARIRDQLASACISAAEEQLVRDLTVEA